MSAADTGAAVAADGVDLVDEDDRGRLVDRLAEQVAHPTGADPDEHLDEVRARQAEERDARFAGHGPGEQRLARARWADEQDALGDAGAQAGEALRVPQVLDHLTQLGDGLIGPGDVRERDVAGPVAGRGAGPTEGQRLAAALHVEDEPHEHADDQERGQQPEHDVGPEAPVGVVRLGLDPAGEQLAGQRLAVGLGEHGAVLGPVGELALDARRRVHDRGGPHPIVAQAVLELVETQLLGRVGPQHRRPDEHDDEPDSDGDRDADPGRLEVEPPAPRRAGRARRSGRRGGVGLGHRRSGYRGAPDAPTGSGRADRLGAPSPGDRSLPSGSAPSPTGRRHRPARWPT